ncbi:hypothetical protein CAI16_18955 [Virgibacillus dokdonensis]|uniref:Permease n=1 Tax=Virgibacillus dokdonensis TaxID=302167 RepID=A0A3E0WIT5_9BACI|nr:hypothetical protein [Virgibacillus dokdonensis]RFA32133.1 hypothetical protein CAI16_18955 [Virgibacillus dokdonensis]
MIHGNKQVKEYLEDLISIKWLVIGVIFYFYGYMLKNEIVKAAYETGDSFNNWDITLRMLNDMYLIVYFIIPIVLFLSIKTILVGFDYHILVRLGSFKKWVYYSIKQFWFRSFPLLFLWVFVSLFMMIGFPYSWDWSQISGSEHITNTLNNLVMFFDIPITAFVAQITLILLTLSLFHIVLATLYVMTNSKNIMILISALIFLGSIIGFKILPKELAFLAPSTYFSITNGINTFNSPVLTYIIVLMVGILNVVYLPVLDFNKKTWTQFIKPYIPACIYLSLCLLGIISTANYLKSTDSTIWDVWIMSFRGSSAEYFSYLSFFFYLIVYFGFIYLVQLFLNNEMNQLGYYKIIRFRNLNRWFWSCMKRLLITAALFLLILTGISLIIGACFGMDTSFDVTVLPKPLHEVAYHFFINGFLQIVLYIFAVFIVSWISKEPAHGVILISVFMVLMLPGVNVASVVPVGLNSIVYLTSFSPYNLTFILISTNVIALCIINFMFKQSLKI